MKFLTILLLLLPTVAYGFWWCGANGRIYQCSMESGTLEYPEVLITLDRMFPDVPEMKEVAKCESGFKQEARGKLGEVGVLQIMPFHIPEAEKIGFDVYTIGGNISYGRYLYDQYGLTPWSCAKLLGLL